MWCDIKTFWCAGCYVLHFSSGNFAGKMALAKMDAAWMVQKYFDKDRSCLPGYNRICDLSVDITASLF